MQPTFLSLSDVIEMHADQLERYGGDPGSLDIRLQQSALAMPSAGVGGQYFHEDLYAMAAAYLYHLVQNHSFVDGNKRVGAVAAIVFLDLNGCELDCRNADLAKLVLAVSRSETSKAEIAAFFRQHCRA